MKQIKLTRGKFTLVDDEDFEELNKYKWYYGDPYVKGFYQSLDGVKHSIYLHRLILDVKDRHIVVDHINNDKLDNRKENLRACTQSQNCANSSKCTDNLSGYKGVYLSRGKYWIARITYHRKLMHLGIFPTKEEAAIAYNKAALKYFGEFVKLNEIKNETIQST